MKEQPNYYAIIPASIRYDKSLPMGAKMMYGEITALSNQKGYCFASNGYFADLYGCTRQAISKWVKQLEKSGYVSISYTGEKGSEQRQVSIAVDTPYQPQLTPLSTTVDHNNTSSNSTSIYSLVVHCLNEELGTKYKSSSKKTQSLIHARVNEGATIEDFKKVIRHMAGKWKNDRQMSQYLRPITLFGTKFESYLQDAERSSTQLAARREEIDLPEELSKKYKEYTEHVAGHFPTITATVAYLSKRQFKELKDRNYTPFLGHVGHGIERRAFNRAHKDYENGLAPGKFPGVWEYFVDLMKQETKAATTI